MNRVMHPYSVQLNCCRAARYHKPPKETAGRGVGAGGEQEVQQRLRQHQEKHHEDDFMLPLILHGTAARHTAMILQELLASVLMENISTQEVSDFNSTEKSHLLHDQLMTSFPLMVQGAAALQAAEGAAGVSACRGGLHAAQKRRHQQGATRPEARPGTPAGRGAHMIDC